MSEQALQSKILKYLEQQGFWAVKTIQTSKAGTPDILACAPDGTFVAIEVKWGKNKPSPLQKYTVDQINKRQGIAIVAWSLEEVKKALIPILPL